MLAKFELTGELPGLSNSTKEAEETELLSCDDSFNTVCWLEDEPSIIDDVVNRPTIEPEMSCDETELKWNIPDKVVSAETVETVGGALDINGSVESAIGVE